MFKRTLKDKDRYLITRQEPASFISGQFRKLRTKIFHTQNGNVPGTILITSSVQGEGKSTVAANLAVSISQGLSEHVLLVDCDLRCPSVHSFFDIDYNCNSGAKGLSDYLKYREDISNFIFKTEIDKLSVLPAGNEVDNPAELLASKKAADLIHEMKTRYNDRCIVLDSTPIISTTESTVLANIADAVIFVVKAGSTPRDMVEKSLKSIKKEKILGIVFNDAEGRMINKYKHHHYYYYNKRFE